MLTSFLAEDSRRRDRWSRALADLAVTQRPGNRAVLGSWISRWSSLADEAALGVGTILAAAAGSDMAAPDVAGRARAARDKFLDGLTDTAGGDGTADG